MTTHGIYSSHMAEAGKSANSAYDVSEATVTDHAVWWLWPNTCLMRYPGRGNLIVMHIIPVGPERTLETYDFFLETAEPTEAELDSIRYIDEVLQPEDIGLVESVPSRYILRNKITFRIYSSSPCWATLRPL